MLNLLIIANWIVIGLVGSAMVYALALAVYDSVADVKRSKALQANSDLYQQLLLDDVYYRDSYAELFTSLLRTLEDQNPLVQCDELDDLKNAVNQFIDDSKVVR